MPDWASLSVAISLFLSLITVIAAYILFSGLLSDITVLTGSPPVKKITFAYKFREGPYSNCGQLFKESLSVGPKLSCIAVFYDDPKKVNYHTTIRHSRHNTLSRMAVSFTRVFQHFTQYFCLKIRHVFTVWTVLYRRPLDGDNVILLKRVEWRWIHYFSADTWWFK